jgi:membrane associated rhomboid family serine protease
MKTNWLIYFSLSLLFIGGSLYSIGRSITGTWRESIVWFGTVCGAIGGIVMVAVIIGNKLETQEDV